MTACKQWKDRLLDFVLEASSPAATSEVEQHLRSCSRCYPAVVELRSRREQMDAVLRQLVQEAEPSPEFRTRVLAEAERRERSAVRKPAWVGAVAGVAVAVLAAVLLDRVGQDRADLTAPDLTTLSTWQSPTDWLLESAPNELLESTPRLGEFYFRLEASPVEKKKAKGGIRES
jgi:anti-sigma factor RsiW